MGKIEEGSDGDVAWQNSPMTGPRLKEGREKEFAIRGAGFGVELRWRDLFDKAELAGVEKVADRDCYRIVMSGKNANNQTRYYDKTTNLLTRVSVTAVTPMGDVATDTVLSDCREEGGIVSAHKLVQNVGGQQLTISIKKVEYNTELPAGIFDLPAEIKALVKL